MVREPVAIAACFAILFASVVPAVAQPYPNKPVKVVVSHAAGSSPDVVARLAANRLAAAAQ